MSILARVVGYFARGNIDGREIHAVAWDAGTYRTVSYKLPRGHELVSLHVTYKGAEAHREYLERTHGRKER